MATLLFMKIPPNLPFPKGGTGPSLAKRGSGEIFDDVCTLVSL
jgi:hypothetical protein